ncbi:hypothetical protein [Pseudomonas phage PASB7]|nr:hypothetical protein [Pseudomonas phage PASB7]
MAYPYSDMPFGVELDTSTLGSFGLGGPQTQLQMQMPAVDVNAATSGGGFMSGFSNIFSRDSMFGGVAPSGAQTGGWVMPALGIGQAVFGAIGANRQQRAARDQLAESRRQFDMNYGAQRQSINTNLEDRQRARVASNPTAYESVDSYMERNRIR